MPERRKNDQRDRKRLDQKIVGQIAEQFGPQTLDTPPQRRRDETDRPAQGIRCANVLSPRYERDHRVHGTSQSHRETQMID